MKLVKVKPEYYKLLKTKQVDQILNILDAMDEEQNKNH